MSQVLLTVGIPTYNRLSDLKACLKTVEVACGLVDDIVEICVSDNCSSDGTLEFLKSYKSALSNVRFRWKRNLENIGGTKNIKSMLDFCSGKYIYWITDDDLMLPNAIMTVIALIRKYTPTYIRTSMIVNLVVSRRAFYYGSTKDETIRVNSPEFWKLLGLSHVLTGTVHINDPKILSVISESQNTYVCVDMLLYNASKLISVADVCNIHTWENEVFWEEDINYMSDVGKEREKKERKLNLDFQLCIYFSPCYESLDKADLVKFLTINYGFLADEIYQDISGKPNLVLSMVTGIIKFKAKSLAKYLYRQFKKSRG